MTEVPERAFYCPSCRCPVKDFDAYCPSCETGKPPLGWPEDLYIGRTVGEKYRLEKRVSSGGFGIVFLATQLHQNMEIGKVIIKMLHPEHAFEPTIKKRFINEAKAARTINNPHVVKVFDLDFDKAMIPYMVLEYVKGDTLSSVLEASGRLGFPRAVSIALQVAEGMKEAHDTGILHRDLKPDNIILQQSGRSDFVKLIDFGIARFQSQSSLATASFIGTPRYMSPEQIQGRELDERSDIFSLGVILFEMITGQPPILARESEIEYLNLNVDAEPRRIIDLEPSTPAALSELVSSMLNKDPRQRPLHMDRVVSALVRIAESQGWKADHTGSYRVGTGPGNGQQPSAADASIHRMKTRTLPGPKGSGRSGRKMALMLLAGGLVALLIVFGALGVMFFSNGKEPEAEREKAKPAQEETAKHAAAASLSAAVPRDAGEPDGNGEVPARAPSDSPEEEPDKADAAAPPDKDEGASPALSPSQAPKKKDRIKKPKQDPWTKI
jgi:tRNA A-37 threonylcarbamoyl transferase component Bud32